MPLPLCGQLSSATKLELQSRPALHNLLCGMVYYSVEQGGPQFTDREPCRSCNFTPMGLKCQPFPACILIVYRVENDKPGKPGAGKLVLNLPCPTSLKTI
jgi:hypothetical protein